MDVTHALLGRIVESFERSAASASNEAELISWLVFGCSFLNLVMGLVSRCSGLGRRA